MPHETTRTIEVIPVDQQHVKGVRWKYRGHDWSSRKYDTKNEAVSLAKKDAKDIANSKGVSVGLKIFSKNNEYQRQHVYKG